MSKNPIVSEILQGLIALVFVASTVLILLYQIVNKQSVVIPDVLAGFDGVVVTFYFARAGQAQIAQAVTNGALQVLQSNQANATVTKSPSQ